MSTDKISDLMTVHPSFKISFFVQGVANMAFHFEYHSHHQFQYLSGWWDILEQTFQSWPCVDVCFLGRSHVATASGFGFFSLIQECRGIFNPCCGCLGDFTRQRWRWMYGIFGKALGTKFWWVEYTGKIEKWEKELERGMRGWLFVSEWVSKRKPQKKGCSWWIKVEKPLKKLISLALDW